MSFLSAKGLGYTTSTGQALVWDVNFDLEVGATLAIAGPNGAGKTSLLNMLSGIVGATQGDVLVNGHSLQSMPAATRARQIALVSQNSTPDNRLTLQEYVALGQLPLWAERSAAQHRAALSRVLEQTRLTALADKPVGQLSGGERQRAHIARALAQEPQLLCLDEPTNHLDPDAKGRVLSLVAGLGVTVIMIVHDLVLIPEFATHVAMMKNARMTAFGPVADVLTPDRVRETFGVDYLVLSHEGRMIPTLDIRKTHIST
ncbi:MAG: ABC transporter ATP-binding protein [Paracoccaceae bacterium]